MQKEELKEGTSVFAHDGDELGEVNRFVLDPETNEVTHIVIRKGGIFSEDKVVPFDLVRSASEEGLELSEEIQDYDDLPPFEETHFIEAVPRSRETGLAGDEAAWPAYYWYPPYGYLGSPTYGLPIYAWPITVTEKNIPEGSVPLREGTDVISSDGKHIGYVERLLLKDDSHEVTHFVISQGLFFKDRKLVPANWIRSVSEDKVQLNLTAELLDSLPAYEPE